jgi:hypothetical protein
MRDFTAEIAEGAEDRYLKQAISIAQNETAIDRRLNWAPTSIVLGLLTSVLCRSLGVPGIVTAFALMMFGASGLSLVHYKTERGMWMLAGLIGAFVLALWAVFVVMTLRDALRAASNVAWVALDGGIAMLICSSCWRMLLAIAFVNYRKFRGVRHVY